MTYPDQSERENDRGIKETFKNTTGTISDQIMCRAEKLKTNVLNALKPLVESNREYFVDNGPYRTAPPLTVSRATWFGKFLQKRGAVVGAGLGASLSAGVAAVPAINCMSDTIPEVSETKNTVERQPEVHQPVTTCMPFSERPCVASFWVEGGPTFVSGTTKCGEDFEWGPCMKGSNDELPLGRPALPQMPSHKLKSAYESENWSDIKRSGEGKYMYWPLFVVETP